MSKVKRIRIDQRNENERMEVNGREVTCGTVLEFNLDGVELSFYFEHADKGYYVIIERIDE